MVFHWRLSDSKSPQVSRILLNILAVFNNALVWMVSTRPPTSKSSRIFHSWRVFDTSTNWRFFTGVNAQLLSTLLSILTGFGGAVVCMVSFHFLVLFQKLILYTVSPSPFFFSFSLRGGGGVSKYLTNFRLSFIFTFWFAGTSKSTRWLFFFLIKTMSGHLTGTGLCISISKSQ